MKSRGFVKALLLIAALIGAFYAGTRHRVGERFALYADGRSGRGIGG